MRVLMVNKYLYPRAGAEAVMLSTARLLLEAGHQVAFFGMAHPQNSTLSPTYTFPLIELGQTGNLRQRSQGLASLVWSSISHRAAKELKRAIDAFKPDIIHAHNVYNQLSPSIFQQVASCPPVVMTIHDYKPVCPSYNLFVEGAPCERCLTGNFYHCIRHRCIQNSLVKSAAAAISSAYHRYNKSYEKGYQALIAPSLFMKEKLVQGGIKSDMIHLLYNFVETDHEDQNKNEKQNPDSYLFYGGRLCFEKGVGCLIEAYLLLPKSKRIPLVIAGDGPLRADLQRLAATETAIEFCGYLPPERLQQKLKGALCSVVPSLWYENCSMAILEAMAAGKAVIASKSGGNQELLQDQIDGLLFRAGDTADLAKALLRLIENPSLAKKMGQAAKARSKEFFSPERYLENLLKIYQMLVL